MAALGALRSDDVEEMVGRTLALHSLLQALQSMLKDGGERAQEARAILEAACREAHAHGQVEEWMIIGVLSAEKKDC